MWELWLAWYSFIIIATLVTSSRGEYDHALVFAVCLVSAAIMTVGFYIGDCIKDKPCG